MDVADCYAGIDLECCGQFAVLWPGGSGRKENVEYWEDASDCDGGSSDGNGPMAIAADAGEAKELLSCDTVVKLVALDGGCGIWECCGSCEPDSE